MAVDSLAVAVCDNIRIDECQIYPMEATEDVFRGYIASKKRFFYGLKMHVLTNAEGQPVEVFFKPGSRNDTGQVRNQRVRLAGGSNCLWRQSLQ